MSLAHHDWLIAASGYLAAESARFISILEKDMSQESEALRASIAGLKNDLDAMTADFKASRDAAVAAQGERDAVVAAGAEDKQALADAQAQIETLRAGIAALHAAAAANTPAPAPSAAS